MLFILNKINELVRNIISLKYLFIWSQWCNSLTFVVSFQLLGGKAWILVVARLRYRVCLRNRFFWFCSWHGFELYNNHINTIIREIPERFNVIGTVGSSCEIRQVELNLIPALIESHGHGANEWLDSGGALVVGSSESSSYILVIKYLHFEGEVFLQLKSITFVLDIHS